MPSQHSKVHPPFFDAVVVGGGVVGAATALALAHAELSTALLDPYEPGPVPADASWDSRIYTMSPGNAAWLGKLGIWQSLPAERLARVEAMQVYGDRARGHLRFSAYDAGLRELAWTVENRALQHALWRELESSAQVQIYRPARCAEIAWEPDCARLALSDGREIQSRLVIGADGADSWVRERAGISAVTHDYGQIGVVANFAIARPHEDNAFQWFRSDGVLALLPLPGARVSMVWSAPELRARELLAAEPHALAAEVARASCDVVGTLELLTPATGFPLKRLRVDRLVGPRVALVGDAAHTVHPLAGQGMNLGLRDARELVSVLMARGAQTDCGDFGLLRRYERARKEDILALELATDGLEKLFSHPAVWVTRLRNLGFELVDAQALLKNLFVHRAAV